METLPVPAGDEDTEVEQLIAESLLPYMLGDSNKSRYLSYRVSGFTIREAIKLTGIHQRTVQRWRAADPEFARIDGVDLPKLRKELAANFTQIEWLRNYRLVLLKDFEVLMKSIQDPDSMSKHEQQYVKVARKHYTPQQLEILQRLLGGGEPTSPKTFAQLIIAIHQERSRNGQTYSPSEGSISAEYH